MIVLAIDTCDSRGSVAAVRDGAVLRVIPHASTEDYSSWLLPAVDDALRVVGIGMGLVDGYAVAAGPGSFTGLRVGLTTVKAWSEVYGKPVAAISRLEALAGLAKDAARYVAAFIDAHRGQVFGAVYERNGAGLKRLGDELVIAPGKFVEMVAEMASGGQIAWISPDAAHIQGEAGWKRREALGEIVEAVSGILAQEIGRIGARELAAGRFVDALRLDANYVRRSDAEMFWKDSAAQGG